MITRIEIVLHRSTGSLYVSKDQVKGDEENPHGVELQEHIDAIATILLEWHRAEPDLFAEPEAG